MSTSNIMIILLVSLAVIGTIVYFFKQGIRPNSIIGKMIGKDNTCAIKECKKNLKLSNFYEKHCNFHKNFIKASKNKNLPIRIRAIVEKALETNENDLKEKEKNKLLDEIKKFI